MNLSFSNILNEETIIFETSDSIVISDFERRFSSFATLDIGLRKQLFAHIKNVANYLLASFTSSMRYGLIKKFYSVKSGVINVVLDQNIFGLQPPKIHDKSKTLLNLELSNKLLLNELDLNMKRKLIHLLYIKFF